MVRPNFPSRLSSLPSRLKGSNGASNPSSVANSRSSSPKPPLVDSKFGSLVLRTTVVKARNLAAKDRGGTSDPYLVLNLGDAREATSVISKSLNPEWNQTIDLPIVGEQSLILEVICWDKDRFGKDYMGEFDLSLEEIFTNGTAGGESKWYPLQSKRTGKKKSVVTGEVLLQFAIFDPSQPSASPEQLVQKFLGLLSDGSSPDEDELELVESGEQEEDDASDEVDETKKAEKRRKRLRLARLKRKAKRHGYEFTGASSIAGVLFLEIVKITDLPPEKNMTKTSFDCDPFVVTSLGKKTYRTKVVRHNLNPVFEEKLVFQVLRHETNYSMNFSVVDRDKLSGNDFIGMANFPLEKVVSIAPEADPNTGLYRLPEPDDTPLSSTPPEARRSRFRLPMSRSPSSSSLSKATRRESPSGSERDIPPPPPAPTSNPTSQPIDIVTPKGPANNVPIPAINVESREDSSLTMFELPLDLKKEKWESKHSPVLYVRAKYLSYQALRQQFWRAMLKQYDADDSGRIDKVELTTMLDNLGSTLHEDTIDGFFDRFASENNGEPDLSFDQAVICLEDQLQRASSQGGISGSGYLSASQTPRSSNLDLSSTPGSITPSVSTPGTSTPTNSQSQTLSVPSLEVAALGKEGEEGSILGQDDLADDKGEEHVIEIRECPICHQPRLNKKSDADIVTHVATCASQDWRQVNNIVMAGFVTSSQAQRKWYSKVITKISYGGYKLGANSANILVQDRITGQINEERMSMYVRLGIRLLYKGLKSREMEKKRIRKLLKSLSIKQGKKYDDPASVAEIQGFINFHQLDMSEVLHSTSEFKSFNEFFYRALKPGARPCSAPNDPRVITSPADCRSVVFNRMDEAQGIWVKGREFSIQRLLGDAYPDDVKRYTNGALGIFRLAPQDYHRFHIPVDGIMGEPKTIAGEYYTVNPMAIRSALDVYGENVRILVPIDSQAHGRVMVVCVGAMMVGSTIITAKAGSQVARTDELGYFAFGGSTILLLFEPGVMKFDDDLVDNSNSALETLVRVGMSIGHSPDRPPHTPDMRKDNPTSEEKQDAKRRIEGSMGAPREAPAPALTVS